MSVLNAAIKSMRESEARLERHALGVPEPDLPPVRNVFEKPDAKPADVTMPPAIAARLADLNSAKDRYGRIQGLIAEVGKSRSVSEVEYREAFSKLSENEAAIALDGIGADQALRKTVAKRQESLTLFDARLAGLQRRLQDAHGDLDRAMRALSATEAEWADAQLAAARLTIRVAMSEFVEKVTPHFAVTGALNDRLSHIALSRGVLLDPENPAGNLLEPIRFWRQHPTMPAIAGGISSVREGVQRAITDARFLVATPEELAEI